MFEEDVSNHQLEFHYGRSSPTDSEVEDGAGKAVHKDSELRTIIAGYVARLMTPSRSELGLTEELAAVPIHAGNEVWTLEEGARHLYHARRSDDADPRQALTLAAEFARLRHDAKWIGDTELVGAADALEKSARAVFMETC